MPQPLRMHQIRRIIELQLQGRSIRETEKITGISRNTIREYLRRLQSCGLSHADLLNADDESLTAIFHINAIEKGQSGRIADERYKVFEARVGYYCTELRKRGVTRFLLWKEYRNENEQGYEYSQFCEYLSRHLKRDKAVMHFTHQPGEQLQVDFAGDKLSYIDRSTGEVISCEVLVCTLPFSHYIFAKALRSQRQEDFIGGLGDALTYIGGVPQSIKCDNMRTAVTRANRYEPVFTEAMEYMAAHYGTTVLTARVRKPRDKASVEKAVDLTYKNIYAPLRHHMFYSLEELNAAMRKQLDLFNAQAFKVKAGSRQKLFETEEKPTLRALPTSSYLIKNTTESKVQRNYHIIVGEDRHQYSVPYTLIGKRMKIVYTTDTVEVYDGLSRVALHKRSYKKNGYTTLSEHMPDRHQYMVKQRGWDNEYFEKEAARVGEQTLEVVRRILNSRNFHEQSYNSCLGILRLGQQYGSQRLEAACLRIQHAPVVNYSMLSNILKNHLDQVKSMPLLNSTPGHDQIRGPQSYQ